MHVFEPVKLIKAWNSDTGLNGLLRQWNGFEDFNVLNFSNILLKVAIVFKIFECFCPFLCLTIITGQLSF